MKPDPAGREPDAGVRRLSCTGKRPQRAQIAEQEKERMVLFGINQIIEEKPRLNWWSWIASGSAWCRSSTHLMKRKPS